MLHSRDLPGSARGQGGARRRLGGWEGKREGGSGDRLDDGRAERYDAPGDGAIRGARRLCPLLARGLRHQLRGGTAGDGGAHTVSVLPLPIPHHRPAECRHTGKRGWKTGLSARGGGVRGGARRLREALRSRPRRRLLRHDAGAHPGAGEQHLETTGPRDDGTTRRRDHEVVSLRRGPLHRGRARPGA